MKRFSAEKARMTTIPERAESNPERMGERATALREREREKNEDQLFEFDV